MKFETMRISESCGDDYLVATYYMHSDTEADLYDWVKLTAADQSAGTWTHIEGETPEVIEKYGCKVIGVYPMAMERSVIARIAYPVANFPFSMAMIMTTVAGNLLGQDGIRLVDIDFPKCILDAFPGPQFGVEGIRKLVGAPKRPVVGAILKPCVGVTPDMSAKGAVEAALGGAEVIKDDELQSDPEYSPMVTRVKAIMDGLKAVGKDKECLFAINITGPKILDRAKRAIDAGANALMINYATLGWGASEELVRGLIDEGIKIPIYGHSAGMGAYYRGDTTGISQALLVGKLARMIGIDMPLVYPDSGRFAITTNQLVESYAQCISPMGNLKKAMLTPAGGVQPGTIDYLYKTLGDDTCLMAGGGIYGHKMGGQAGAKALTEAIEAVAAGKTVEEAAADSVELQAAIDQWGIKEF